MGLALLALASASFGGAATPVASNHLTSRSLSSKPTLIPISAGRAAPTLLVAAGTPPPPPANQGVSPLLPIWLAVLVQMLGVGITLSTLPLFLTSLGGTPNQLAMVISIFSGMQMLGCPLLVSLSSRVGRLPVLRACLAGNAVASIITAVSTGWTQIACARAVAGLTAASVPVAQVAVSDMMPPGPATSKALSRVASAASLGIICGPAAGGLVAEIAASFCGVHSVAGQSRAVFLASGVFASVVLLLTSRVQLGAGAAPLVPERAASEAGKGHSSGDERQREPAAAVVPPDQLRAQFLCRWQGAVASFATVVGIATYALFALRFLSYGQRELSLTQSAAAATGLAVNLLLLPRLIGERRHSQTTTDPRLCVY